MGRLAALLQNFVRSYTLQDLELLSATLDIPYEHLRGDTLPARALSLLKYADSHGRMADLIQQCAKEFPNLTWEAPEPRQTEELDDDAAGDAGVRTVISEVSGTVNIGGIADVRNNTGNVAVGSRNVIQIGSLEIPRRFVAGMLATVAGLGVTGLVLLVLILIFIQPKPAPQPAARVMNQKLFNVVVADFGEADDAGSTVRVSEDGSYLANLVYEKLSQRLASSTQLSDVVDLQHDNIGLIQGATPEERTAAAAILSEQLNVDVVIYGSIVASSAFVPEFYVSPALIGAAESTGPNAFGTPVDITLPLSSSETVNRLRLQAEFIPRAEALAEFMSGLALTKAELPDAALKHLESAGAVAEWKDEKQGKEVLYLWLGTAFLERARLGTTRELTPGLRCTALPSVAVDDWGCAELAYTRALSMNPTFARAHIGLGRVKFDRITVRPQVTGGAPVCRSRVYEDAAETTKRALEPTSLEQAEESAYVPLKVWFNVGVGYANGYTSGCPQLAGFHTKAIDNLITATQEYRAVPNPPELVQEIGARAYFNLGRTYLKADEFGEAIVALTETVSIARPGDSAEGAPEDAWRQIRWRAFNLLGQAYAGQAKAGNPARWENAIQLYSTVVSRTREPRYKDALVSSEAYLGLGEALRSTGQWQPAINALLSGASAVKDGLEEAQKDAYRRVLLRATLIRTYEELGLVYEAQGDTARARQHYEEALKIPAVTEEDSRRIRERLEALEGR